MTSQGVILSAAEMGVSLPNADGGKGKGQKQKKKSKKKVVDPRILILPKGTKPGTQLMEVGRKLDCAIPVDHSIEDTFKKKHREVEEVLNHLEMGTKYWKELWDRTGQWSLTAFKEIYKYLGCRFDIDFYESECSEISKKIVEEYLQKGVFRHSKGSIGCFLKKNGFCMLLKSNGAGLYATKDLALARRKFDQFAV